MLQKKESTHFSNKKVVRDTYSQHSISLTDKEQENLVIKKIYGINFGEQAMVIVSKHQLIIYGILTMKPFYQKKGWFWDANFIPGTSLIVLIQLDGTSRSRRTLQILDLKNDQIIAKLTIKYEIESVKTNKNCICLIGVSQISVFHFPTLKPICHELAGSGLKILFDMSFEGLTLAYSSQKKGGVTVHNFSNVSTNRARRKSTQFMKQKSKSAVLQSMVYKIENAKKMVEIKAHHQFISTIRLSPNGTRVATASHKGTVIRIFLTQTGKLWEQLRVGYELCKILDIAFYQEGNALSCLTQKSLVFLFNAKLQPQQEQAESEKRGYKIYQQANPKSMFSFLSFFNSNLGQEHPFAFFKLIKPEDKKKQASEIHAEQISQKKSTQPQKKQEIMSVVQEQMEEIQQLKKEQINTVENIIEAGSQKIINQGNHHEGYQYKAQRSPSIQYSQTSSKRGKSLLQKLNILQAKKDNYDYAGKMYNTVSKIYIGGNNFVWVAKGPYLFTLKYDPFNGGEMYHKETLKFC